MSGVKGEKTYLIERIREKVTLIRKEKVLSLIKASKINLEISLGIIIKENILRVKHRKKLQYQKAETCLIIMFKMLNIKNL